MEPTSKKKHKFVLPLELLGRDTISMLQYGSSRLYTTVWNRLKSENRAEVAMTNGVAADRVRISVLDLEEAQQELSMVGLLEVDFDSRPGFVPAARRAVYRLGAEAPTAPVGAYR